jgi:hypothetical protein
VFHFLRVTGYAVQYNDLKKAYGPTIFRFVEWDSELIPPGFMDDRKFQINFLDKPVFSTKKIQVSLFVSGFLMMSRVSGSIISQDFSVPCLHRQLKLFLNFFLQEILPLPDLPVFVLRLASVS